MNEPHDMFSSQEVLQPSGLTTSTNQEPHSPHFLRRLCPLFTAQANMIVATPAADDPKNGPGVRERMLDAPSNGTGVRGRPPAGRNAPRRRRGRSAARGPVPLALQQKGLKALTRQVHLRTPPKPNRAERRNRDALGGALACHQQSSRSLSNSTNAAFKRARQFMFEAERAGVAG